MTLNNCKDNTTYGSVKCVDPSALCHLCCTAYARSLRLTSCSFTLRPCRLSLSLSTLHSLAERGQQTELLREVKGRVRTGL